MDDIFIHFSTYVCACTQVSETHYLILLHHAQQVNKPWYQDITLSQTNIHTVTQTCSPNFSQCLDLTLTSTKFMQLEEWRHAWTIHVRVKKNGKTEKEKGGWGQMKHYELKVMMPSPQKMCVDKLNKCLTQNEESSTTVLQHATN